jgi:hypoxanthine-DNA glycosylase
MYTDMTSLPVLQGFPPVTDQHTRLLILGSFPGVASLDVQQYYAHPRNQFWRLVSALIGVDLVSLPYAERLPFLRQHGIGVWDVIANADRKGSLDTNIRNAVDNDLIKLLHTLPALHTIGFNGGTAARTGLKALGEHADNYRIVTLPSSSPAHTMPYDTKLAAWQELRSALQ